MFRALLTASLVLVTLCLFAGPAGAVLNPVSVTNFDFEQGSGTNVQSEAPGWYNDSMINGGTSTTILTGWTAVSTTYRFEGRWNPSDSHYLGATDGDSTPDPALMSGPQVAFMHWGAGVTTGNQTFTTTDPVLTIQTGVDYTLTVAVGSSLPVTAMGLVTKVQVSLLADGVNVATTGLLDPPAAGVWADYTATLTKEVIEASSLAGKALKVELLGRVNNVEKRHVDFDNVRLTYEDGLPPPPAHHMGDANEDGSVDLQDFGLLKENFGAAENAIWNQGDFNADGAVDLQDFGILKEHFGHTAGDPAITAVPEPATMSLLALGGLALLRRKR